MLMYDNEDDEEYIEDTAPSGPASGGYGGASDDDEDDDEDDEQDEAGNAETLRRETAEQARGKEDRSFYDNLAKQEDERHNAMRKDKNHRSLLVGEARQKLRHKDAEVKALGLKIQMEEDRIVFEQKKAYRNDATLPSDVATPPLVRLEPEVIPILSRDIDPKDMDEEFSIERAQAHIKQLKEQKAELDKVVAEMRAKLSEEERALSQLEHQIMRM